MADNFDKHIETQYANKPYFVQLKRVWRMAKKIANPDKPKKIGFFLQQARKLQGSAQTNEKIIHDIFGKSQQMSANKFIEGVFEHGVPEGEKMYIKPETAYQTTQRLMPDTKRGESTKLNKTIQVSVFGDIYDKILNKYKDDPDADDLFRAVNRYLSSHFANAAGFVRWTHVSPNWIHIDAFQTDFFSNLKSMAYNEGKSNPKIKKIVEEFRKHEDEFFKTAVSYIVRTNPGVKIFTASTPEIVAAVENVRGDVKLKKYYHQIPKKLGFKLVGLDKLNQILRTRPGKKAEALIKKFEGAVSKATGKGVVQEAGPVDVQRYNVKLSNFIDKEVDARGNKILAPQQVDKYINDMFGVDRIRSAYHQYIDEIADTVKKAQASSARKDRAPASIRIELKKFLESKKEEIIQNINRRTGVAGKVWWANRGTIFESVENRADVIVEEIKQLSRY
jgi:hypothetical protein